MKKLNVNCPINGTGYGITAKNIVFNLSQNLEVSLFPIGNQVQIDSEEEKNIVQKCLDNSNKYDRKAPCLKIWHQHDLASKIGEGKYFVFPFFEIDKLTKKEVHQINSSDEVFTASHWGKNILENNGVNKPIHVAPLGVNLEIFKSPTKIRTSNNYVFFHIGKWEMRKSQDVLIESFNKAFNEEDNVELWMLPQNPFLNKEEEERWYKLAMNSKLRDKIKIYNRLPTHYHLAEFIFQADCGVFVSRAEGWNNEIPESMAMNKPIIATNYSAHTEYCTNANSFLVDISETEPANDGKWFHGNGNWAKIGEQQFEQIVEYMRYVYKNNIKTNPEGFKTAQNLSWLNTSTIVNDVIFSSPKPKKKNDATATKKAGRKPKPVSN